MTRREQLAWCAGFFDGEGNVCKSKGSLRSQTAQIHPAVLERMRAATGIGRVNGPYPMANGRQPLYFYSLNGFEEVQAFVAMVWPWLGDVKRSQARRALFHFRTGSRDTLENNSAAAQGKPVQAGLKLTEEQPQRSLPLVINRLTIPPEATS